jgi:hypothetical protein
MHVSFCLRVFVSYIIRRRTSKNSELAHDVHGGGGGGTTR